MAEYCNQYYFGTDNQERFEMVPDQPASFEDWLNRPGPYFQPAVNADGYLYWTNNGGLPNPEPVRIVGKDGRGITLTGQCETVAELPEDPEQGEAWAVGEEEPFECYAWFGEWVDLGPMFPAGQDGVSPAVTITPTATGHKVKITDKDHPSGQEFDVENGTPGAPGEDGVSPAVTITPTSTGHKVKITDKTHPAGQEFDVENGTPGAPGQGVPAGGSAGQFLRKASGTNYDAEWYSPTAGDFSYDSSLTYPSGTVGQELSSQRNTLNKSNAIDGYNVSKIAGEKSIPLYYEGLVLYETGEFLSNSNYTNTGIIPLKGFTHINASIYLTTPGAVVAYFNENLEYMKSVSTQGTAVTIELDEDIPSGAVYAVVSRYGTNANVVTLTSSGQNIIDTKIGAIQLDVDLLKGKESNDINGVYSEIVGKRIIPMRNHIAVMSDNGAIVNSDNYRTSDLISTKSFDRINLTTYAPAAAATVAYYNSNKEYMSAVSHAGANATVTIDENIPSGAAYVRFSRYGTDEYSSLLTTTAESFIDGKIAPIENGKVDRYYDVNMNKDPLYSNIVTGASLGLDKWTFIDNAPTSYNVSNGKLTYQPAQRSDRLIKLVGNLVGGHKYYLYLPISSTSQDAFITINGGNTQQKNNNSYIEAVVTISTSATNSWVAIQGNASYSYVLGEFVMIDLTANGISETDASFIRTFLERNAYGDLQEFIIQQATANNGIVNVKDFGAKGDGITNDTEAIADAIRHISTNGILYFPAGNYLVSNIALKSNMTVRGEGMDASIISFASGVVIPNLDCLNCIDVSNVHIEKVGLFGNRTNNQTTGPSADGGFNGIHILRSDHITVNEIKAYSNGYHGIIMVDAHDVEILNSKFYDNGFRPIHGHSTVENIKILNCECYANGQGFEGETGGGTSLGNGFDALFFFGDVDNLEIAECYVHDPNSLGCIEIGGAINPGESASKNIHIHDNVLIASTLPDKGLPGIRIMGAGISNVQIDNNHIKSYYGIRMHGDGSNYNITISGNTIIPGVYGIYSQTEYADVIISENKITNDIEEENSIGMLLNNAIRTIINSCNVSDFKKGVVFIGCDDAVVNSCCSGNVRLSQCIASLEADDTSSNIKMVYNLTNANVVNLSEGGIIL